MNDEPEEEQEERVRHGPHESKINVLFHPPRDYVVKNIVSQSEPYQVRSRNFCALGDVEKWLRSLEPSGWKIGY